MLLLGYPRLGGQNAYIYNMKRVGCGKTNARGRRWRGRRPPSLWDRKIIKKMNSFWNPFHLPLGAEKKVYGSALGGSWKNFKTGFSHLGGQKAPQMEAKRLQNRVQEATPAQNGKTLKFAGRLQRKPYFSGPEGPSWRAKSVAKCCPEALDDHIQL